MRIDSVRHVRQEGGEEVRRRDGGRKAGKVRPSQWTGTRLTKL